MKSFSLFKLLETPIQFLLKNRSSKKYLFLLLFLANILFTTAQSKTCSLTLNIENNLNVGSASIDGSYYKMVITNTSSFQDVYTLSTNIINSKCINIDGSNTTENINLNTVFVDENLSSISEIPLNAGQSTIFYSHVQIPLGTKEKKWCCTEIIASSKNCSNLKSSTIIHTFFNGSNDD